MRSPAEESFARFLDNRGITYEHNIEPDMFSPEVDFLVSGKVIIEIDGKEFHDRRQDKKRDARLKKAGYIVFRIPASNCFDEDKLFLEWKDIEKKIRQFL